MATGRLLRTTQDLRRTPRGELLCDWVAVAMRHQPNGPSFFVQTHKARINIYGSMVLVLEKIRRQFDTGIRYS